MMSKVADSNVFVTALRCEYMFNPIGIDIKKPRLSEIVSSRCG